MSVKISAAVLLLGTALACGPADEERRVQHEREERDRQSAAFKAGEMAHEAARKTEKAAAEAERRLADSARKAKEGWDQKDREDRQKDRGKDH